MITKAQLVKTDTSGGATASSLSGNAFLRAAREYAETDVKWRPTLRDLGYPTAQIAEIVDLARRHPKEILFGDSGRQYRAGVAASHPVGTQSLLYHPCLIGPWDRSAAQWPRCRGGSPKRT